MRYFQNENIYNRRACSNIYAKTASGYTLYCVERERELKMKQKKKKKKGDAREIQKASQ
jgi:hypothetical protein